MRLILGVLIAVVVVIVAWILLILPTAPENGAPAPRTPEVPSPTVPSAVPDEAVPTPAPEGGCRIFGVTIVDHVPAPATVAIRRLGDTARTNWMEQADPLSLPLAQPPLATVVSGAHGRFAVEDLPTGKYRLDARTEAGHLAIRVVRFHADGGRLRVVLRLEEPGRFAPLSGRVTGPDGKPFTGRIGLSTSDHDSASRRETWTSADEWGRFSLSGPLRTLVRLVAHLPGRLTAFGPIFLLPHPGEYHLDLSERLETVTVRVTNAATGAAVSGATVLVEEKWEGPHATGETGADGRCVLPAPPATRDIEVRAAGYPPAVLKSARGLVEVRLRKGARVSAQVVDAATGRPVAGARVYALPLAPSGNLEAGPSDVSDRDGRVTLIGVRPGEVFVFAAGGGWLSEGLDAEVHRGDGFFRSQAEARKPPDWIELDGGLETELKVVPAAAVSGRVVSAKGEPVVGASVKIDLEGKLPPWTHHASIPTRAATDSVGRFRCEGYLPGSSLRISVTAPGYPKAAPRTVRAGTDEEVEIRLRPACEVEVRVLEEGSEAPVPGASVYCGRDYEVSDAEGRALFRCVPPGDHRVQVVSEEHLEVESVSVLVPDPPARLPTVNVRLRRGGVIVGRAVLPDGSAPLDGWAKTSDWNRDLDEHGGFRIPGLTPGEYEVEVSCYLDDGSFLSGRALGRTDGSPLLVKLVRHDRDEGRPVVEEKFTVRVVGPDGEPIESAFYFGQGGRTLEGGVCELNAGMRGGTVAIHRPRDASGMPTGAGAAVVPIPEDPGDDFQIRLPPERLIRGRVVDDAGKPLAGVRLLARPSPSGDPSFWEGADAHGIGRSGADGTFVVRGLGEFDYYLWVEPPPGFLTPDPVPAAAGSEDARVTLSRGLTPVLRVVDEQGNAIPNVRIKVMELPGGEDLGQAMTDAEGDATLPSLPDASTLFLWVLPPEGRNDLHEFQGEWDPTPKHTLVLERKLTISGTVVDWEGKPLPEVMVWCREERADSKYGAWHSRSRWADGPGAFRIRDLRMGHVQLAAGGFATTGPGGHTGPMLVNQKDPAPYAQRVAAGASGVRLEVAREACLVLEVRGLPEGVPTEERPDLRSEHTPYPQIATPGHEPGRYLGTGLVPGREYTAFFRLPTPNLVGYATGLAAGGSGTLTLEPGGEIAGNCVIPDGLRIRRADVWLRFEVYGRRISVRCHDDGSFRIPGLPDVEVTLKASAHWRGTKYHAEAAARPGESVTLHLLPE